MVYAKNIISTYRSYVCVFDVNVWSAKFYKATATSIASLGVRSAKCPKATATSIAYLGINCPLTTYNKKFYNAFYILLKFQSLFSIFLQASIAILKKAPGEKPELHPGTPNSNLPA